MTSNFPAVTHTFFQDFLSPISIRKLSACVVISAFPCLAVAADDWTQESVRMVGVKNYFMERCVNFGSGEKIEFNFSSQHPVNFNVHYHPENSVLFKIEKENLTELSDTFTTGTEDNYCFTWTNPTEVGGEWPIQLKYRIVTQ